MNVIMEPGKRIEVICNQIMPGVMAEFLNGKYSMEYATESLERNMAAASRLQLRLWDGEKYTIPISDCYRSCLRTLGL